MTWDAFAVFILGSLISTALDQAENYKNERNR